MVGVCMGTADIKEGKHGVFPQYQGLICCRSALDTQHFILKYTLYPKHTRPTQNTKADFRSDIESLFICEVLQKKFVDFHSFLLVCLPFQ